MALEKLPAGRPRPPGTRTAQVDFGPRPGPGLPVCTRGLDSLPGPLTWTPGLNWRPRQPRCSRPHAQSGKQESLGPGSAAEARLPQRPYPQPGSCRLPSALARAQGTQTALGPGHAAASPTEQDPPAACGRSPAPRRAGFPPLVYTAPQRPPRRPRTAGAAPFLPLEQRQPATALRPKRVVESELKWRGL